MTGYCGRRGQAAEFIEYGPVGIERLRFVAQRSGRVWFVYQVHPGKDGMVQTVYCSESRTGARKKAYRLAAKVRP